MEDDIQGTIPARRMLHWVQLWHDGVPNGQKLQEFLGLTDAEYQAWLMEGNGGLAKTISKDTQTEYKAVYLTWEELTDQLQLLVQQLLVEVCSISLGRLDYYYWRRIMLQIGQRVYSVDQIEVKHTAPLHSHTYVAEKVVNGIHQARSGEITYMAGDPQKLVFQEISSGQYRTSDSCSPVFLTYEAAENERLTRIRQEGREVPCGMDFGSMITDGRYTEQKQFIDKVAASIGCAVIQPNCQGGNDRPNMVLLYFLDDAKHNASVDQETIRYSRKEAADFEQDTGSPVDSKYVYRDYIWSFQNTDQYGRCSADFANEGRLDLRGPDWQTVIEGSMKLAYYEKLQNIYLLGNGGVCAIREADATYNDLNRRIIDAFYKANRKAFLGDINLSTEKRKRVTAGTGCIFEEYTGQLVYNFGCTFVVPVADRMLEQLILDWNGIGQAHKQPPIDKIMEAVKRLDGRQFLWY